MTLSLGVPTVEELQSFKMIAEVAASNPYWKKLGGSGSNESIVATILSVMLLARELGISPIQAVSGGINNIQGKFEISARLMNQLIRKHGHKIAIKTSTDDLCVIWSKRRDTGEEWEERYHIDEARRSGLIKDGSAWKKVPSDMLFARCISRLARRLYADALGGGGIYIEGELQEMIQGKPITLQEAADIKEVKSQMEFLPQESEIQFPENVDKDEAMEFIEECSKTTKTSLEIAKKKANENMDKFLKAFESWKEKKMAVA